MRNGAQYRIAMKCSTVCFCAAASIAFAGGDFTPPKDGKLTESQLIRFIDIQKQQVQTMRAAAAAGANNSSLVGKTVYSFYASDIDAAVESSGMSHAEFDWIMQQVGMLYPVAIDQQLWEKQGKPDLGKQIKALHDDSEAAQTQLEAYVQAQKTGTRVMSQLQRKDAIAAADTDRKSIAAEFATDETAINPISDELTQHQKDVADAESLAKNPPANLNEAQKDAFIDQKKNDAQTARDAANDCRERLNEAQKNLDDARTLLTLADNRIAHPEVPVTEEESKQVKTDNDRAIAEYRAKISEDQLAITQIEQTPAAQAANMGVDAPKLDSDNLALMQKHLVEYLDALGVGDMLNKK
jgi:hypothetical protein